MEVQALSSGCLQWSSCLHGRTVFFGTNKKDIPIYLISHPNFNALWFFDDVMMLHSNLSCCMAPHLLAEDNLTLLNSADGDRR